MLKLNKMANALHGKAAVICGYNCTIRVGVYSTRAIAIQFIGTEGLPVGVLTVNVPGTELGEDELLVRAWGGHSYLAGDALQTGWFEDTGRRVPTGFVEAQIWRVIGL